METKSCVIFGVSVQNEDKLYVLHDFLRLIKNNYNDCKVFIGINYDMHTDIESIIDSYDLNVVYERLQDATKYTATDDSAYQLALKLFYADPNRYNVCWFMHTKGGFHERDVERKLYIENFYTKRLFIESKFAQLPKLGVYGYRAIVNQGEDPNNPVGPYITNRFMEAFWKSSPIDNFDYSICKTMIVETMFALNASLMYKFLDTYNEEFFNTTLRQFFFECEVTNFLASRSGYYPAIMAGHMQHGSSMDPIIDTWIEENQLTHLREYKNLIRI
jgi:hypothetical protein